VKLQREHGSSDISMLSALDRLKSDAPAIRKLPQGCKRNFLLLRTVLGYQQQEEIGALFGMFGGLFKINQAPTRLARRLRRLLQGDEETAEACGAFRVGKKSSSSRIARSDARKPAKSPYSV